MVSTINITMKQQVSFYFLLIAANSIGAPASEERIRCPSSRLLCIDEESFTLCNNYLHMVTVQDIILKCPKGYSCQESRPYPCYKKSNSEQETTTDSKSASENKCSTGSESKDENEDSDYEYYYESGDDDRELYRSHSPFEKFVSHRDGKDQGSGNEKKGDYTESKKRDLEELKKDSVKRNITIDEQQGKRSERIQKLEFGSIHIDKNKTDFIIESSSHSDEEEEQESVKKPDCRGPGKYPGPSCGSYYECKMSWLMWWEGELKECSEGERYNNNLQECMPQDQVTCSQN